jgi:phosphatidylglycerophosphate synthase
MGSASRHAANAITALRVALTPVFAWCVLRGPPGGARWPAAVVFTLVAVSDFIDGRIARRFGAAGSVGQALDHAADIAFILTALGLYVALGAAPWWVPTSIAASFAAYVVDSLRRSGTRRHLIGSRIGHLGGICNYVLIGVLVGNVTLGLQWLPAWLMDALFALVPLYSAASVVSRWGGARRAVLWVGERTDRQAGQRGSPRGSS